VNINQVNNGNEKVSAFFFLLNQERGRHQRDVGHSD